MLPRRSARPVIEPAKSSTTSVRSPEGVTLVIVPGPKDCATKARSLALTASCRGPAKPVATGVTSSTPLAEAVVLCVATTAVAAARAASDAMVRERLTSAPSR